MLDYLLYLIVLLLGIPFGLLLRRMCGEEIASWKGRLKLLSMVSLVLIWVVWFSGFEFRIPVALGLLFLIVTNVTVVKR